MRFLLVGTDDGLLLPPEAPIAQAEDPAALRDYLRRATGLPAHVGFV